MNKTRHDLTQLMINNLFGTNEITPVYIGEFPHISYLPAEINKYCFYYWRDTTKVTIILSINTQRIRSILKKEGKKIRLNVSHKLVEKIMEDLLPIFNNAMKECLKIIGNEEEKNELNYFKHWISRTMLQYWETRYISKIKGNSHLIIYDKKKNAQWNKKVSSKNDEIPFGEYLYNDEFLEKEVFFYAERHMGILLSNVHKNKEYEWVSKDYISVFYFWIILVLRNKNTILNFSNSLKKEILNIVNSVKKFKEFKIEHFKHDITSGTDKYTKEWKIFKNLKEIQHFLNEEEFFYFAKDVYWRHLNSIIGMNESIYDEYKKGRSVIKDALFAMEKNFYIYNIGKYPVYNLSDYPCLSFKFVNGDILPINFDKFLFEDYILLENFNIEEYYDKVPNFDVHIDRDLNITKASFYVNKLIAFDIAMIPVNPNEMVLIIKKEMGEDFNLKQPIINFLTKHGISKEEIDLLTSKNETFSIDYFYNLFTYLLAKDFIVLASEDYIIDIPQYITQEKNLLDNLKKIIESNKENYIKDNTEKFNLNNTTYIETDFCNYIIK